MSTLFLWLHESAFYNPLFIVLVPRFRLGLPRFSVVILRQRITVTERMRSLDVKFHLTFSSIKTRPWSAWPGHQLARENYLWPGHSGIYTIRHDNKAWVGEWFTATRAILPLADGKPFSLTLVINTVLCLSCLVSCTHTCWFQWLVTFWRISAAFWWD